jgi:2',3'-cyclic-nucleotide 2'-phosphodiesterase (5'-nucleotidase family)
MKFPMRTTVPLALTALAAVSQAEESLYSRRMSKRGIDAQGNYNICEYVLLLTKRPRSRDTAFFHINDVHAHLDEFSSSGTDCTRPERGCYGGYSRVKTVIEEQRPKYNDSLWLNVGDEFQGTLFYSFYGGEKIAETLNNLEFDAMTLGNHEFDGGEEKLGAFLQNLTFPIVCANLKSANEKVASVVKPYHIFEDKGLALIGVTTEETPSIANPDDGTIFSDVVEVSYCPFSYLTGPTNTNCRPCRMLSTRSNQRLTSPELLQSPTLDTRKTRNWLKPPLVCN